METYVLLERVNGEKTGVVMKADFAPNVGDCVEVTTTYTMKVAKVLDEAESVRYKDMPVWIEKSKQKN